MRCLWLLLLVRSAPHLASAVGSNSGCSGVMSPVDCPNPKLLLPEEDGEGLGVAVADGCSLAVGLAPALLIDGALYAYGFALSDRIVVSSSSLGHEGKGEGSAERLLTLGVVSNTGAKTFKTDADLCVLDRTTWHVRNSGDPPSDQSIHIREPQMHDRLITAELHILRFETKQDLTLSVLVNGEEVRDMDVYGAGEHETPMDFLGEGWNQIEIRAVSEDGQNRPAGLPFAEVKVFGSKEPPNVMFQFPPDDYEFNDPGNVNVALLVTYFAFHRYPNVVHGFLQLSIDRSVISENRVQRDAEGVYEMMMNLGAPFNQQGHHQISVQLLDDKRKPTGGATELFFQVDTRKVSLEEEQREDHGPLGAWASFRGDRIEGETCSSDVDCSQHAFCAQSGVCTCQGDWIGAGCNTSLADDTEYYPEQLPYLLGGREILDFLNGSRSLLSKLRAIHSKEFCSPSSAIMFDYNDQGLAAQVSDASVQLTYAFKEGKAAAFVGEWTYGLHKGCREAPGIDCHFLKHFDCAREDLPNPDFESHPSDVIPEEFKAKGSFWWYAHVTHFLLQVNTDFQLKISATKALLGFQGPTIGVHVRNGDYCTFENDDGGLCLMYKHCICDGFEPYLERIREMQRRYGISSVFLATQDERILTAARAQDGLRVMALPFDRDQLTGKAAKKALHWRQKQGYVDTEMLSESALLDMFLLKECDVFIGAFHSQYSRLAYQLMAMRQGVHPPFASVHLPWKETLTYPL